MALNTVQDFELRMHGPILENPKVEVEQSDTASRKVRIHLKTFGGEPYIIPYAAAVTCYIRKTDGTVVWNTCEVADENTVEMTLTAQALACAGKQKAQLYILTDGGDIKSQGFYINVPAAVCREDAVESENEFGVLGGMMQDNREIREAEEERIQAEQERTAAEEERAEAEKRRAQTEWERMAAENERAFAEKERITAEGDRKAAEQARIQAEEQRNIEYQTALTEIDAARSSGVSAVQEEGAAQVANVQAAAAEIASDREQIGKNRESTAVDAPGIKRSVSGNLAVLDDASEKPLSGMTLYGRSEQFTTTGAQLIPAPINGSSDAYALGYKVTKAGVTFEVLEDWGVKVTGKNDGSVEYAQVNFMFYDNERPLFKAGTYCGANIHGSYQFNNSGNLDSVFTLDEDELLNGFCIAIRVDDGTIDETFYPMLNAGDTALRHEPYTGGQPSPSPDYPQKIVSAGQVPTTGAQLFDITKLIMGYGYDTGGNLIVNATRASIEKCYIGPGEYTVSNSPYAIIVCAFDENGTMLQRMASISSVFSLPENTVYAGLTFYENIADISELNNVMLNAGPVALPREPYTDGIPGIAETGIEVEVKGKNLIPDNAIINTNSNIYCFRNNGGLLLKGGVSYTMSTNIKATGLYFRDYDNTNNRLKYAYNIAELTYTPSKDELVSLDFYFEGGRQDSYTAQLEISDKPTTYEPYRTPQTLSIPTPNGLPGIPVTSNGNYTDENGQQWVCDEIDFTRGVYVQRIAQRVLDGEENWNAGGLSEDLSDRYWLCDSVTDGIDSNYSPVLCTDYCTGIVANNNTVTSQGACAMWKKLRIRDNSFPDVDTWKQHLQEHNVTIMYILNAPIETDLTPEQLAAYHALHTFYPATVVSAQAGDLAPGLNLEYIADTENYMANEHQKLRDEFDQKLADILALLPVETQAAMIANETNNLLESEELL